MSENHHWDDLQDQAIALYEQWLGTEEPTIDLRPLNNLASRRIEHDMFPDVTV